MISASRLTLRRGPRALLEDASFSIHGGWHVGLIGRNGTGKSTLFAAILGELAPDKGEISSLKQLAVATAAQETPALPDLAIEFALDGDVELRDLERRLAKAEESDDIDAICSIHERLGMIGGYAARARAAALLHGLSFSQEAQQRPVSSFSGGWRMRLNLARALMCRSDVLLLDEPTNHLDLDAVIWLQGWLAQYPGLLMVISHDREFLDAVTTHTLHLESGKATLYTGNYSQFERQRAERLTLQAGAYAKQQKQVAHLQKFINRFRASAAKASQAQSRIKALERMELVSAVHADSEFNFEFPEPDRLPSPLVRFDDVTAGYDGNIVILEKLRVLVAPGERIGLLGQNGAGKSTLVQTIAGAIPALSGDLMRDGHLRVGYFAQHTTESLDDQASPILHFKRIDPKATEQELRGFLGGFNFRGDRVYEPVGPFSGGEKARLALAMVVYQAPNLLLLDEPTNHLDLDMRHALETALIGFAGAVIVVSHDRHLLTSTCERLWLVADGRCVDFDGDLDDYAKWLNTRDINGAAKKPKKRRRLMALKATIFKAQLAVADMDRQHYADYALTLARHPSETDERMMLRLVAFALHAHEQLAFGKGLSDPDEPDLWRHDLTGLIEEWIQLGQPDERDLIRACGKAGRVTLYTYGNGSEPWWAGAESKLARARNLSIRRFSVSGDTPIATLAERTMNLHCTIQDRQVLLGNEAATLTIDCLHLR